ALSANLGTQRFLREIEVLANLQHPNILTLIDSGEVDGLPYYVMPFVEGQSLRARLDREGALPLEEAVQIAAEVAEGLESAHQRGVVHRDVKPANVLISGGHAVVADFGIAAALDESALGRLTEAGISLGSPAYMSTEQASGEGDLDGRTDVYALGCVLYEMLAGKAPVEGSIKTLVTRKFLGDYQPLKELRPDVPAEIEAVVSKAMDTEPDRRFPSAKAFREALLAGLPQAVPKGWGRRRTMAASAAVLLVAIIALVAIQRIRSEDQQILWATQTLAQVEDLVDVGQYTEALALAEEVEEVFPEDTTLADLLARFSFTVPIRTDPPGASVYIQDMKSPGGEWKFLGKTPLEEVRFAGLRFFEIEDYGLSFMEDRPHRLRFELDGYNDRELQKTALLGVNWRGIPPMDVVELVPKDPELDGMVKIPGFTRDSIEYRDYFMDRYEVTNRAFQDFVDAGGYRNPEYWVHAFINNGSELSFEDAMALTKDQTGRAGPSTWRLGTYPEGEDDYPVGGVSWYEAAAYARWAGKELPTTDQWNRGRLYYRENSFVIVPRSNLGSAGPRPVGRNGAMTTLGVYDLAGNVREWCFNEAGDGERATRGGAWTDAPFHVGWVIPKPALDRHETNGFRLIRTSDDEEALAALRDPVGQTVIRDYRAEEPASDAEFEIFRRFYAYDPFPLNPIVERVDTFQNWVREKVSFDLPYGER
ncbi:MAG: protein kinase, partial [Longimicrobiales bacterium]|nr:protein kinase [Longimicrobiales bacterium]